MINAIILAGGKSRRMGKPKPLLRFGETTFLEQIVRVLRESDVDKITVVLGAGADMIRRSVDLSGADVIVNKDYRKGQLSSLIAGLRSISSQTDAILLCLVDNPFITEAVVSTIVRKFKETKSPIVVPVFNGQRGHPTLFSRCLFKELLEAPEAEGARHVLYAHEDKVVEVEVDEPGVLIGIDTPEDYKTQFGTDP